MNRIIFECETVTPMFMAGAKKKSNDMFIPELRPPSFKGVLRFWWRAINSDLSVNGIKNMKEIETSIFGGSGSDKEQKRSKVSIRIKCKNLNIKQNLWDEIPHENKPLENGRKCYVPKKGFEGISYLLYSVLLSMDKGLKPYIDVNTPFQVVFSSRDVCSLYEAVRAFLFMTYFGALGARSRRGAGNFRVIKKHESLCSDEDDANAKQKASEIKEILKLFNTEEIKNKENLEKRIKEILNYFKAPKTVEYSVLEKRNIFIFDPVRNDWKKALEKVGSLYKEFRDEKRKYRKNILITPSFGFPINHRRFKCVVKARNLRNKTDVLSRRSSPVIFKLVKTTDDLYFPIIIHLGGKLIPDNYELFLENTENTSSRFPDKKIVRDFFRFVIKKEGKGVTLI